jgi:hypothetical protein
MDCDPQALIDAARCFRCIRPKVLREVMIYLLCQWATQSQCVWYAGNNVQGVGDFVAYDSFADALAASTGFIAPSLVWGSPSAFWLGDGSAEYVGVVGLAGMWHWQIGLVGNPNADNASGYPSADLALAAAMASAFLPATFCR